MFDPRRVEKLSLSLSRGKKNVSSMMPTKKMALGLNPFSSTKRKSASKSPTKRRKMSAGSRRR